MDGSTDLPICDQEPIHIPGSIQPHGMVLVATRDRLAVTQAAGDVEGRLGVASWHASPLASLIGPTLTDRVRALAEDPAPLADGIYIGRLDLPAASFDVSAHLAGLAETSSEPVSKPLVVVELEAAAPSADTLLLVDALDHTAASLQRAHSLEALFAGAAHAFRALTGFDRVLIYRFNHDDAGQVVGESLAPGMTSFMNHFFPASDIPRQARALYVRNPSRVIPDIHYVPAPIRPAMPGVPLDMSDCALRSVSPIHLQYMFNMGMRASASFSLIREGTLWGLVACHNVTPRGLTYDVRAAGRMLAGVLTREIRAKEEAEFYRQRLRLRNFEDETLAALARDSLLDGALARHLTELRRAFSADGVAILRGNDLISDGCSPTPDEVRALVRWLALGAESVRATDRLSELYPQAGVFAETGSGLLAIVLSTEEPWAVLCFRAEQVEALRWAGEPQTGKNLAGESVLSPRSSFKAWVETVRNRSRRWSLAEIEAAGRLHQTLLDLRQSRRLQDMNRQLSELLRDKTELLQQKEFLTGEINRRVEASLRLVGDFLGMQARASQDRGLRTALDEARRRLAAVELVHRRLHRGQQIDVIDAARYVEELCADTLAGLGPDWQALLSLDLAPLSLSVERAVPMGLVLTELIINANKYAYGGRPGPLEIRLVQDRARFSLSVADRGATDGREAPDGFGARLMRALVAQIGGEMRVEPNRPGLRVTLTATTDDTPGPP